MLTAFGEHFMTSAHSDVTQVRRKSRGFFYANVRRLKSNVCCITGKNGGFAPENRRVGLRAEHRRLIVRSQVLSHYDTTVRRLRVVVTLTRLRYEFVRDTRIQVLYTVALLDPWCRIRIFVIVASFSIIFAYHASDTITEPQHTDMRCVIVVGINSRSWYQSVQGII